MCKASPKSYKDIAAGKYKGPLHGIPWGAKDIISVKGFKTTWGSPAFKDQVFDYDASVVEMLREGGAVLIAKLTTGELAGGAIGLYAARVVKMTQMPELVALMHSLVGLAACLVGFASYVDTSTVFPTHSRFLR